VSDVSGCEPLKMMGSIELVGPRGTIFHSGIETLVSSPQSRPRFKREPTWPAGRKRNADQTSSMATMDTARHPVTLIASRIMSRLRSPPVLEVFFGI
jgi:hypothetical protein